MSDHSSWALGTWTVPNRPASPDARDETPRADGRPRVLPTRCDPAAAFHVKRRDILFALREGRGRTRRRKRARRGYACPVFRAFRRSAGVRTSRRSAARPLVRGSWVDANGSARDSRPSVGVFRTRRMHATRAIAPTERPLRAAPCDRDAPCAGVSPVLGSQRVIDPSSQSFGTGRARMVGDEPGSHRARRAEGSLVRRRRCPRMSQPSCASREARPFLMTD